MLESDDFMLRGVTVQFDLASPYIGHAWWGAG